MTSASSTASKECPPLSGQLPAELTPAERAAVAVLAAPSLPRDEAPEGQRRLDRFLQPLSSAGEALGLGPEPKRAVETAVLRTMQETGTAYGSWDKQQWAAAMESAGPAGTDVIAVACQLGCLATRDALALGVHPADLAKEVFGQAALDREVVRVRDHLRTVGYARCSADSRTLPGVLGGLLLLAGRPQLEALTIELIEEAHSTARSGGEPGTEHVRLSRALYGMGLLPRPIPAPSQPAGALSGVDPVWAGWCLRWRNTSTAATNTKRQIYYAALKAGRWLALNHPEIRSPDDWTRDVALAYVSAVNGFAVGDLNAPGARRGSRHGAPIAARGKDHLLCTLRMFFRDCQEWGWARRRFDASRALATPPSVMAQISPNPRVIADEVWARILRAGVNLTENDLAVVHGEGRARRAGMTYPFALVKAIAITWLFAGLRSDELVRLRLGCIRWQRHDGGPAAGQLPAAGATCLLDVPIHKTGVSYTKPVDPLVGQAIAAWEAQRPRQPLQIDRKTGERVPLLFCLRGRSVCKFYLNESVIPLLCQLAGVSSSDARGRITSHRARSTIASQLYNAKEPMSLFELQAWLGHRSPTTTLQYARITPTTLARAYADANYFARNVRAIEVLIDQDALKSTAGVSGETWRYYDLGHGLCSYEFFDQCPHRIACARCDFYNPKESSRGQLLEAKSNLLRLLQEVPLPEDERAAVDGDLAALDRLAARLADQPTPSGQTPNELKASSGGAE